MKYQIYYMDNDGQKKVIEENLSYTQAVKRWQYYNTNGLSTDYEIMK